MAGLLVSRAAIEVLFAAPSIVMVERRLQRLVPRTETGDIQIVPFEGQVIGDGESHDAVPLLELGLPTSVKLILESPMSRLGQAWLSLGREIGMPDLPKIVRIGTLFGADRAAKRVGSALEAVADASNAPLQGRLREREQEIIALRDLLEARELELARARILLRGLGFAGEELALDTFVSRGGEVVRLPASQPLGVTLKGVRAISVYKTSPAPATITVAIAVANAVVYSGTVEGSGGKGWMTIFLPEPLTQEVQDAQISFSTLEDVHLVGSGQPRRVGLRFWRNKDDAEPASPGPAHRPLPALRSSRHNTHAQLSAADRLVLGPDWFARLQPTGDLAHFAVQSVVLGDGDRVIANLRAPEANRKPIDFALLLVPHGTVPAPDELQRALVHQLAPGATMEATAAPAEAGGRQDVILVARGDARDALICETATVVNENATPRAFFSAAMAQLHNHISFADGPSEEEALNSALGYAHVAAADGQSYLQTHPVQNRVAGARLLDFVPVGTTRLWINAANEHPRSGPTEFIAAVLPEAPPAKVHDWFTGLNLPDYHAYAVADLPDGGCVARVRLEPAQSFTMDIALLEPATTSQHLYLLVRRLDGSTAYGWCRWNFMSLELDGSVGPGA